MSGGFFRGTNHDQDNRFADKEKKLKAQLKFPDEYDIPVDMTKVKLEVIKPWITKKVTELLGFEDEVVINLIFNMLEKPPVDPKDLQINLTGFLERNTKPFVLSLWKMLVSASRSATGIPDEMLEKKKQEILEKKMERERIDESRRKREERRKGSSRERDRDRDNHRRDRDRDRDSHNKDKEREKEKERDKEREKEKETVKKEEESEKDKKKRRRWDRTTESPERLPALGPIRENRNSKATNRSRSKSPPKKKHSSPKGEDGNQEPKKSKKKKREKEKDKEKQRSRSPSEPPAPSAQEEDEAILRARALHSLKKKKDDKVKTEEDDTDEV